MSSDNYTPYQKISYGSAQQQFGELYVPPGTGPHPIAILIHGGFWRAAYDLSLMDQLAQDLVYHGIAAWNIEYRRIGEPGGGWPGTLQDVAQAVDYLNTLRNTCHLDLHRIVTIGHSAGGHLALWLAARPYIPTNTIVSPGKQALHITGAISLAGAIDLRQVWQLQLGEGAAADLLGGSPEEVADRYDLASPTTFLPLGIPQVLIHGTVDDRVPLIVSQAYKEKASAAGDQVTLVEIPGGDHFVVIDPGSRAWTITLAHVQRLFTT